MGNAFEGVGHCVTVRVSVLGDGVQCALDDALDWERRGRSLQGGSIPGSFLKVCEERLVGVSVVRRLPDTQEVKKSAKGEDVRRWTNLADISFRLLGRHKREGTTDDTGFELAFVDSRSLCP